MEVLFIVSALFMLVGTLILITQKHAIYALMGLLIAFIAAAGVFAALGAVFVAIAQILIYAGALAVLFLFVLMFTDTRTPEDEEGLPKAVGARPVFDPKTMLQEPPKRKRKNKEEFELPEPVKNVVNMFVVPRPMAIVISLSFLVCFTVAIVSLPEQYNSFGSLPVDYDGELLIPAENLLGTKTGLDGSPEATAATPYGGISAISKTMFEGFPLAFEVVSLVIFAALLGAVLLARRHLVGAGLRSEPRPERGGGDA